MIKPLLYELLNILSLESQKVLQINVIKGQCGFSTPVIILYLTSSYFGVESCSRNLQPLGNLNRKINDVTE